ncbi:hypothetical protein FRC01_014873, partial [Tulasnella sp. 417]
MSLYQPGGGTGVQTPVTGQPNINTIQAGLQGLGLHTGTSAGPVPQTTIDQNVLAAIVAAIQMANQNQAQTRNGKVKIKEPEPYNGKGRGGEADRFILACENYFRACSSDFPNDETRVQFALSYLTDTAQAWGDVILRDLLGTQNLATSVNWKRFKKEFLAAFGDPDKEGTATRKLEDLTQGNRPATSYIADFRRLKVDVPWNEKGLRSDIKDGMVYHKKPTTLEGYMELARQIDDRIWERKQEKAGDSNPHPKPQPRPQPSQLPRPQAPAPLPVNTSNAPNAFAHSQPVHIHIDASEKGKPSPEERERRRKEGLCYYCGEKGHTVAAYRPRQGVVEKGLRADIKDGMVYHKKPTTLEEYIELVRQIDDRIWERKQEKAGDSNPHPRPQPRPPQPQSRPQVPAPPPTSNAPNAFAHAQPVPIHIDASRKGKPSPEERERRRREGLCYYCGEKGHTVAAHRPRQGVVEYYPPNYSAPSPYNPFQRAPAIAATNPEPLTRNPFRASMSPAPSNNSFTVSIAPQSTASSDNTQQDFSPSV